MNKKYRARLTSTERHELEQLVKRGVAPAYRIKHAHILLAVDADGPGWTDEHTAAAYRCNRNTVAKVRQRCVEQGLEAALNRKKQVHPSRQRLLDGEQAARLVAIACSTPPAGRAKWTLQLLADELVALEVVETISHQTVRRTLKKTP